MKEFPCIESTVEVTRGEMTVRVWVDLQEVPRESKAWSYGVLDRIKEGLGGTTTPRALLRHLKHAVLNLNAAQIIYHEERPDSEQVGTIIYTVPFEEIDHHG